MHESVLISNVDVSLPTRWSAVGDAALPEARPLGSGPARPTGRAPASDQIRSARAVSYNTRGSSESGTMYDRAAKPEL